MKKNQIICGDALKILKTFPDESIDCCITSPPYFGLRDYGTAKWEGGDEECEHRGKIMQTHAISNRKDENKPREIFKKKCGKCGAKRIDQQIGLEQTPEQYVDKLVKVFREVRRVLKKDGTCWLNLGDSYAGSGTGQKDTGKAVYSSKDYGNKGQRTNIKGLKSKDLIGIPWRTAFALQSDGWWLRQDIIWHKTNPMPESVTDRCTKSHEYIFLLTKNNKTILWHNIKTDEWVKKEPNKYKIKNKDYYINEKGKKITYWRGKKYYYDNEAIKENAKRAGDFNNKEDKDTPYAISRRIQVREKRNKRSVWTVNTKPFKEAHFAVFPEALIEPMIKTTRKDAIILDPFFGAGTTGIVTLKLNRSFVGIDLSEEYCEMAKKRIEPLLLQQKLL